jgi:hypothetical protein
MYYENDSDETDTIILYDSDDSISDDNSFVFSEELQVYEEDLEFIQDINAQEAFDDITQDIDNQLEYNGVGLCIGTYKYIKRSKQFLYIMNVPPITFLKYNSYMISKYFYWHSSFYVAENPPVDLIRIYEVIEPGSPFPVIYCIIKTFWIKIIQRVWRRVFRERMRILRGRSTVASIRFRELNGHFPEKYRVIPKFTIFSR